MIYAYKGDCLFHRKNPFSSFTILLGDRCQYLSIRRAERIIRCLGRRDPLVVVVLKLLRFSLRDGCVEPCQMHRPIGIFVQDIREYVTDRPRHRQLFPALAVNRLPSPVPLASSLAGFAAYTALQHYSTVARSCQVTVGCFGGCIHLLRI